MHAGPLALVIEDDFPAAEALGLVLKDWGADFAIGADEAQIRAAAGARLEAARFIITDFRLSPTLDGVTCARSLLKDAPDARVLVVSGSTFGLAAQAAAAAGFAFLAKPVGASALIAWLEDR